MSISAGKRLGHGFGNNSEAHRVLDCTHTNPDIYKPWKTHAQSSVVLLIWWAGVWHTVPLRLPQGLAGKRCASHTVRSLCIFLAWWLFLLKLVCFFFDLWCLETVQNEKYKKQLFDLILSYCTNFNKSGWFKEGKGLSYYFLLVRVFASFVQSFVAYLWYQQVVHLKMIQYKNSISVNFFCVGSI